MASRSISSVSPFSSPARAVAGDAGQAPSIARLREPDADCDIEYQWLPGPGPGSDAPLLVFLHQGLGSLAMWRDFPRQLCSIAGCRGLVYARPGYGRSTPAPAPPPWGRDYLHRQALDVLPALLRCLGVDARAQPPWLFGHSDGGSIALLRAAHAPREVAGAVVLAPHILVEARTLQGIERSVADYAPSGMRQRLARYHPDADAVFEGWSRSWLDAGFRDWSIEQEIAGIGCPLLAVQGVDDEYGTLEQIRGIRRRVPHTELLELAGCGHSPQREQPQRVIEATADFLRRHAR